MKTMIGLLVLAQLASAELRIQEVCYDPEGADSGVEWVELVNSGDEDLQLGDWLLDLSGPNFVLPPIELSAGQTLLIHSNALVELPPVGGEVWFSGANMGNTHGFVGLWSPGGQLVETMVDYMEYGEGGHSWEAQAVEKGIWPEGAFLPDVESGHSLIRIAPGHGLHTWDVETDPVPGITQTTLIGEESVQPRSARITGVWPNPFNPMTRVLFSLPREAQVRLRVYNLLGELVLQPRMERMAAGSHSVEFTLAGHSSGPYLVELASGDVRDMRKILLLE